MNHVTFAYILTTKIKNSPRRINTRYYRYKDQKEKDEVISKLNQKDTRVGNVKNYI